MLKLIKIGKSKFYQISGTYYLDGKAVYIRNKSTKCIKKNDAEKILSDFIQNVKVSNDSRITFSQAVDIYLDKKKPRKDRRRYFEHIKTLSEQLKILFLDELTDDDVKKFYLTRYPATTEIGARIRKHDISNFNEIEITERRKLSSNNNTINTSLINPLQALIRFGNTGNRNWCSNFNLEKLPILSQDLQIKHWWKLEEIKQCMQHQDYEIKFLLIFLFRTGCRLQEALRFSWEEKDNFGNPIIDMENKILRIFQNKTKTFRPIPIHENNSDVEVSLWHWLNKINNKQGNLFTWKNLQDKKNSNLGIGNRWKKMCEFANIDPNKKRHAARHGFASIIGNNGGSDKDIKSLGGWKTEGMVDNYTHIDLERKREILNRL